MNYNANIQHYFECQVFCTIILYYIVYLYSLQIIKSLFSLAKNESYPNVICHPAPSRSGRVCSAHNRPRQRFCAARHITTHMIKKTGISRF